MFKFDTFRILQCRVQCKPSRECSITHNVYTERPQKPSYNETALFSKRFSNIQMQFAGAKCLLRIKVRKAKVSLSLTKHYASKTYGGVVL
jgi:hypothetical protein